jgi:hypothetical protein
MADEDVNGNPSNPEDELEEDAKGKGADQSDDTDADSENSSKKSKPPSNIPYSRFKQVNDEAKQSKSVVDWYRQNVGDPDDVLEFKKWKAEQTKRVKEDADNGDLSQDKLAQFKKLMRAADPEYAEFLENQKFTQEQRSEAQFDEAEDLIRDLSKDSGFPEDESVISRIAAHIMDEVKSDEKLLRAWQAGHTASVIKKAYNRYMEDFVGKIRTKPDNGKAIIAEKRGIKNLPMLPKGGSSSAPSVPKRDKDDKGLTKKAHKSAWDYIQSLTQQ